MICLCASSSHTMACGQQLRPSFLTDETEFVLFQGAVKFCLARGMKQLIREFKSHIRIKKFRMMSLVRYHSKAPNDVRRRSLMTNDIF